jgi:hypothetical protein
MLRVTPALVADALILLITTPRSVRIRVSLRTDWPRCQRASSCNTDGGPHPPCTSAMVWTCLCLLKRPHALCQLRLRRSPIGSSRGVRRRLAAPLASLPGPVTCCAARRNHGAPTPARRDESIKPPTSSPHARRPNVVGVAVACMAWLALGPSHRQARDRRRVAPAAAFVCSGPGRANRNSAPDARASHRTSVP